MLKRSMGGENMALNFEETRDLAKKRIMEKEEKVKPLTEQEKSDISFFVGEMENHIKKYAEAGKQTFLYDCSKLEKHVFHSLARAFKDENPDFYVSTQDGCQELTVDWSDKHEV